MKVLVFAHTPPPHHGQSYMVQIMLENVGQEKSPEGELVFYHVNARLSYGMDDIGAWRPGKVFQLFRYIFQAWRLRWKYAPETLYYVPAPAKRSALYRDWLVLLVVAPLFKVRVFHWHAIGLGQWVVEGANQGFIRRWESGITRRLFSGNELSLVMSERGRHDIEVFSPRRIAVVPNGIPDPCPDFDSVLLPERLRRWRRHAGPAPEQPLLFELLYLAHATRTKGLFDTIDAVSLANARFLAEKSGVRIRLTIAGAFLSHEEEEAFQERIRQNDLALPPGFQVDRAAVYAGYAGPQEKDRLLRDSDGLCFASYFPNEAQPVSVIEALAYGMPVLLSRWRGLPEIVPSPLAHVAEPRDPASLAQALTLLLKEGRFEEYRKCYLERYSLAAHCLRMREAFLSTENQSRGET